MRGLQATSQRSAQALLTIPSEVPGMGHCLRPNTKTDSLKVTPVRPLHHPFFYLRRSPEGATTESLLILQT